MSEHKRRPAGNKMSKIVFDLQESDWHDHATESMWATAAKPRGYRLENVPFYVYGISYHDVVSAETRDGVDVFADVIARSGHSTYRIFLTTVEAQQRFEETWLPLKQLGCIYERGTDYLVAVDVPRQSNIYEVYAALEEGQKQGAWDFEEGHCGHPLNRNQ